MLNRFKNVCADPLIFSSAYFFRCSLSFLRLSAISDPIVFLKKSYLKSYPSIFPLVMECLSLLYPFLTDFLQLKLEKFRPSPTIYARAGLAEYLGSQMGSSSRNGFNHALLFFPPPNFRFSDDSFSLLRKGGAQLRSSPSSFFCSGNSLSVLSTSRL